MAKSIQALEQGFLGSDAGFVDDQSCEFAEMGQALCALSFPIRKMGQKRPAPVRAWPFLVSVSICKKEGAEGGARQEAGSAGPSDEDGHQQRGAHGLEVSPTTPWWRLLGWQGTVPLSGSPLPSSPQWLKDPGPRTEKRTLCCDMVCFLFITPLAAISGWLCLRGAQDHLRLHSRLEAVGLIALTIALFTIYVLWTLVSGFRHLGTVRPGVWPVAWRGVPCLPLLVALGWQRFPAFMELQIPNLTKVEAASLEPAAPRMQGHVITSTECRPHYPLRPDWGEGVR